MEGIKGLRRRREASSRQISRGRHAGRYTNNQGGREKDRQARRQGMRRESEGTDRQGGKEW